MTTRTCLIWLTLAGLTLTLASASGAIAQPNPRPLWERFPLDDRTRSTPRNGTPATVPQPQNPPPHTVPQPQNPPPHTVPQPQNPPPHTVPQPQNPPAQTVPRSAPTGSPSDETSGSGWTTMTVVLAVLAIAAFVNLLVLLVVRRRWVGQAAWTVHGAAARAADMVPRSVSLPRPHVSLPRPHVARRSLPREHFSALRRRRVVRRQQEQVFVAHLPRLIWLALPISVISGLAVGWLISHIG